MNNRIKVWAVTYVIMGQGAATAYFDSKESAWDFYMSIDTAKDAPVYCGAFACGNEPALWGDCNE